VIAALLARFCRWRARAAELELRRVVDATVSAVALRQPRGYSLLVRRRHELDRARVEWDRLAAVLEAR